MATLIAAEYPIYGRYGFGPATWIHPSGRSTSRAPVSTRALRARRTAAGSTSPTPRGTEAGPRPARAAARPQPGAIDRRDAGGGSNTGSAADSPNQPWTSRSTRSTAPPTAGGRPARLRRRRPTGEGKRPHDTATVHGLIAPARPPSARCGTSCARSTGSWVNTGRRAPDDLLPLLLGDPRGQVTMYADCLWLRRWTSPGCWRPDVPGSGLAGARAARPGPPGAAASRWRRARRRAAARPRPVGRSDHGHRRAGTLWLGDESRGPARLAGPGHRAIAGAAALGDRCRGRRAALVPGYLLRRRLSSRT